MSGPLSSNEIEDVVSSVRRLVSADARNRPLSRDLGRDRLILTPALRVGPDVRARDPLILSIPAKESPIAVPPQPTGDAAWGVGLHVVGADREQESGTEQEAGWEEEIWYEEPLPLAEMALEAEEAELIDPHAPHADGGRAVLPLSGTGGAPEQAPWADMVVDDDPGAEQSTVVPMIRPMARDDAQFRPTIPAPAAEPAAEAALAGLYDEHAPPVETGEVVADIAAPPAAAPFVETAAPEATAAPVSARHETEIVPGAGQTTLVDTDGNPLTVLDEDALHEIVRDLIREELQGVLGERITRNVRKLVRAEINRALAARALD